MGFGADENEAYILKTHKSLQRILLSIIPRNTKKQQNFGLRGHFTCTLPKLMLPDSSSAIKCIIIMYLKVHCVVSRKTFYSEVKIFVD